MKPKDLRDIPTEFQCAGAAAFEASGDDGDLPKLNGHAYTGGPMDLGFGYPVVIDLAGAKIAGSSSGANRPVIRQHDPMRIIGHTSGAKAAADGIFFDGIVSGTGADATEVVANAKNGYPWQVSVGGKMLKRVFVEPGVKVRINGRNFVGPLIHATESLINEFSIVALGADDDTSAALAAAQKKESTMDDAEKAGNEAERQSPQETATADPIEASAKPETKPETKPEPIQAEAKPEKNETEATTEIIAARKAKAAEIIRVDNIEKIDGITPTIAAKAISEGWSVEKAENAVFRAAFSNSPNPSLGGGKGGNRPTRGEVLEASFQIECGENVEALAKEYGEDVVNEAMNANNRDQGFYGLCAGVIEASGEIPGRRLNEALIRAASVADRKVRESEAFKASAGAGVSTTSLTGILSNIANKTLRRQYEAIPSAARRIAREVSNRDFKTNTAYRMTGVGEFAEVGPAGQLEHTTLTESSFTNKVETYGRMFALTREHIINDDLNAFAQIPQVIARQAALKRESLLFTLLLANTGSFFASGNQNLLTGGAFALSINGLSRARTAFTQRTDADGKPIMVPPTMLLVPSALEVRANELVKAQTIYGGHVGGGGGGVIGGADHSGGTTTADAATVSNPQPNHNPHAGQYEVVATPYLDAQALSGSSATSWYMLADPNNVSALVFAYLRGNRGPVIESSELDFSQLGMQFRGYMDIGAAFDDPNGAQKMAIA